MFSSVGEKWALQHNLKLNLKLLQAKGSRSSDLNDTVCSMKTIQPSTSYAISPNLRRTEGRQHRDEEFKKVMGLLFAHTELVQPWDVGYNASHGKSTHQTHDCAKSWFLGWIWLVSSQLGDRDIKLAFLFISIAIVFKSVTKPVPRIWWEHQDKTNKQNPTIEGRKYWSPYWFPNAAPNSVTISIWYAWLFKRWKNAQAQVLLGQNVPHLKHHSFSLNSLRAWRGVFSNKKVIAPFSKQ